MKLIDQPVKSGALLNRVFAANEQRVCDHTENSSGVGQFNA